MSNKRVVITCLGLIGSNGTGKDHFQESIFKGMPGIRPISLFDTSYFKVKTGGEIEGFEAADTSDVGVAVGSAIGSIRSTGDFHQDAVLDGPRYVNPAFFSNTVINSPASQAPIRFNIKGFNVTFSTGFPPVSSRG